VIFTVLSAESLSALRGELRDTSHACDERSS